MFASIVGWFRVKDHLGFDPGTVMSLSLCFASVLSGGEATHLFLNWSFVWHCIWDNSRIC